jgi:hypothetical protein
MLRRSRSELSLTVAVAGIIAALACAPRLNAGSSTILRRLGSVSGFSGGGCQPGEAAQNLMEVYLAEIGRRPSEPLDVTIPKFARRAAAVCPQSQSTIKIATPLDASQAREILHKPSPASESQIELEPWLSANVEGGNIVSLTLDLARFKQ